MINVKTFPVDRDEKHRVLMDAVESVRDTLEAGAPESENTATLPQVSVNALYDSGLFRLKLPQVLGGAEADLVTQLDVLEAVCRIDPSAGWCLMIGAASLGGLGAFLPEETIDEIFVDGNPPRTAGVFAPFGQVVPVDGGYRLTGRWSFASGVRHSEWISAGARVVTEKAGYPPQIRVVIPTSDVKIHDNWQVMGLRGTGSCDFSAEDLFVPDRFAWDVSLTEPLRGGAMYRLGRPGFVTNEHSAFALGVGRRALDAVTDVAVSKSRGYNSANLLVRRPAFQRTLSECDLRLRAARALNVEVLEEAWQTVCEGRTPGPALQAQMPQRLHLHHRCCRRRGLAGVPLWRRSGVVQLQCASAVPPRHQRRSPAPDGQRRRIREPRSIPAGLTRRQCNGVAVSFPPLPFYRRQSASVVAGNSSTPPVR